MSKATLTSEEEFKKMSIDSDIYIVLVVIKHGIMSGIDMS